MVSPQKSFQSSKPLFLLFLILNLNFLTEKVGCPLYAGLRHKLFPVASLDYLPFASINIQIKNNKIIIFKKTLKKKTSKLSFLFLVLWWCQYGGGGGGGGEQFFEVHYTSTFSVNCGAVS